MAWKDLKGLRKESIPSHKELLNKLDQREIFQCILGFYPDLRKRYTSIFRKDKNPGCRFIWKGDYLCFIDNATFKGKLSFNVFETLMYRDNMSFYEACKFIYTKCEVSHIKPLIEDKRTRRSIDIRFTYKNWSSNHCLKDLDLTKEELLKSNAYLVSNYWCTSKNDPELVKNRIYNPNKTPTIAWYFPDSNHTKLYFINEKERRFYSNCTSSDIYGYHLIGDMINISNTLIITKSGKDQSFIWFKLGIPCIAVQGESMNINSKIINICKYFKNVYVLFDNDKAGIEGSIKLSQNINSIYPKKSKPVWIKKNFLKFLKITTQKKTLLKMKDTTDLYLTMKKNHLTIQEMKELFHKKILI